MGFFSWITQDTNRSISNVYSSLNTFPVVMVDNNNNQWVEMSYEGYGVFGGKDFYELVAEMNGKKTREEGIVIAFSGKQYLSPNLIELKNAKTWKWINKHPKHCIYQGYFYNDNFDQLDFEEYIKQ